MKLTDYLRTYVQRRALGLARRTVAEETSYITRYIAPTAGECDVDTLTPEQVLSILQPPFNQGHTRTAEALYVFLKTASHGNAHFSEIMAGISRPKHHPKTIKFHGAEQLRRLILESPEEYRLAWILAGIYGMRRGEICGLQYKDIDIDGIHIERQRITVGKDTFTAPLKTAASYRTLPLCDAFINAYELRQVKHFEAHEPEDAFIIPMLPHSLTEALYRCCDLLQIPRVSLHSLRHSAASIAVNAETPVNIRVLQSLLGHSSIATTARVYAHVSPAAKQHSVDIVSSSIMHL